jgi:glycosyltransferase involved in cell wall biosynthesis
MAPTVAYVMSRFPHLPETFILREMIELERCGFEVLPFPLIVQRQELLHEEAQLWMNKVQRVPFCSPAVLAANVAALVHSPGQYAGLWRRTLAENRASPNFLLRAAALLPKAVCAARLMRQMGVQHIHAHYATHPALFAWLIHQLTGISYSITVHAHDIFVRTAMLATKLRDAAFVVAISEYNREHLAKVVGPWARDKIHVVHCGIDPAQYAPRGGAPAGEHRGRFEIISVGSLQPYKGFAFLLQACAMLRDRGMALRCRIIGGGENRRQLQRIIAQCELKSVVELLGPRTQAQVSALLPTADCYVQPSIVTPSGKMEGIPVALMEAMACGVPVVATRLSGIPELVREDSGDSGGSGGSTGWLVTPGDAAALAQAIAAVHGDGHAASVIARGGRELVLREFHVQTNVKRLAELFEQVLAPVQPLMRVSPVGCTAEVGNPDVMMMTPPR